METLMRRAIIIYVRVLLCVQSLFIAFVWWAGFLGRGPDTASALLLAVALIATVFALAGISVALMMKQGRRWPSIVAMAIEVLWIGIALVSAHAEAEMGKSGVGLYCLYPLPFLAAVVGLLLIMRPVRCKSSKIL
jgi:hypothetical protein